MAGLGFQRHVSVLEEAACATALNVHDENKKLLSTSADKRGYTQSPIREMGRELQGLGGRRRLRRRAME
eukprot:6198136-Pleurochrysis_carterae.AAC.1